MGIIVPKKPEYLRSIRAEELRFEEEKNFLLENPDLSKTQRMLIRSRWLMKDLFLCGKAIPGELYWLLNFWGRVLIPSILLSSFLLLAPEDRAKFLEKTENLIVDFHKRVTLILDSQSNSSHVEKTRELVGEQAKALWDREIVSTARAEPPEEEIFIVPKGGDTSQAIIVFAKNRGFQSENTHVCFPDGKKYKLNDQNLPVVKAGEEIVITQENGAVEMWVMR